MLLFDLTEVGNKLYAIRKRAGLTQAEVAELAGLSDRTYADIERGTVNMRAETVLRICAALNITPDEIFTQDNTSLTLRQAQLIEQLDSCTQHERETALSILSAYLQSLNQLDR